MGEDERLVVPVECSRLTGPPGAPGKRSESPSNSSGSVAAALELRAVYNLGAQPVYTLLGGSVKVP